ncbi:PepSY domain-containing protein [Methylicorpusculum oleiharenae]|uniref:PepSY domain-containing protein n=1 Tax=Methylicorpusculum oleiharenae TaxID=1338687 RepID=UPI00135B1791|nr:PepSY domain-containing protein [Methylicorpusculum oleiharenae]MCD2451425.1 PepSY domain-containing protein [Methylicorpusculum oleiharenae]
MKKQLISVAMLLSFNAAMPVSAAGDQALEECLAAVKKDKIGTVLKLEKLNVSGKPFYEVEVKDANGFEWEFMCDASTGKITETESEVADPKSQAFNQKAKITEEDAAAVALKAYPGKIEEVEYEIEKDGSASFEFDIVNDKGVETKVEVDAATGKIIEVSIEEWEIGEESDEKR